MNPLVSILIPAFNAEAWIAATIESALAQTWTRREIIIVDDGSTDQTLAMARRFASNQVSVITQKNQGAAAARNQAFALSKGDFIQWLDADDLLAPDKIRSQIEAANSLSGKMALLSSAWGHFIHRPEKARFVPTSLWRNLSPIEWLTQCLEHAHWMQPASWLVSRELSKAAGPWDTRLSLDDDGEYFFRVVAASQEVRFVPGAKTFYRRSPNSLSDMSQSDKKWESQFLSIQLQIDHLRLLEDSTRTRAACLRCLQRYLIYFYPERLDIVKQAQQLATDLGGRLEIPRLPWKYAWIQKLFGWTAAKRAQSSYNRWKSSVLRSWDKALLRLENRNSSQNVCIG